ncbi:MAG: tetratricopeptide repeat protein [Planctomycetota bacterium]
MISKKITYVLLAVFITVGFYSVLNYSNTFGQSVQESSKDIYDKANDSFASQNWKDAYVLYQKLITKYGKDSFVKPKIKEIEDKISQCEQQLGIIKDITKIFQGKPKLEKRPNGDKVLKLSYDFANEDEIEDFERFSCDEMKIVNKTLQVKGRGGRFSCNLKDAIFMNELMMECNVMIVPPTENGCRIFVFYDTEAGAGYLFSLRYRIEGLVQNCCIRIESEDWNNDLKNRDLYMGGKVKIEAGKIYAVKISAKDGQLSLYINKELVKTVTDKTYQQGLLRFGGDSSCVQYSNIKIEGVVNPSWLDKAFSKATTESLAAKEDDLTGTKQMGEVKMDLSAESDEALAKIPKDVIEKYKKGKSETLKVPVKFRSWREILKPTKDALKIFDEIIKNTPDFAAAYYQRACCCERLGERQNALPDFTKAIEKFPDFYEAYCKRGEVYVKLDKYQEALADYEKCISIKSDYSEGYSGRGYVRFILNERDKALTDIDKSIELDSTNHEAQRYKKNLQHVLKGPLWPISYDKETEHFKIKTDINQDKCDVYGDQLETMRKYYAEVFDVKSNVLSGYDRKKQVYIFNTEEGYQTYAELSTEERAEYTLGYYHPHYQEFLVFERPTKEAHVLKVLYHEGFHMFIDSIIPTIPIWLNEGFAEYFNGSEMEYQQKKWMITKKGQPIERLKPLQSNMDTGAVVSFEQIMNESQAEFYSEAGIRYAQAWSMVHFFLHYQDGTYKKLLMDYIKALKDGKSQLQSFEDTFKKKDLIKMQKEWTNYVKGFKIKVK